MNILSILIKVASMLANMPPSEKKAIAAAVMQIIDHLGPQLEELKKAAEKGPLPAADPVAKK